MLQPLFPISPVGILLEHDRVIKSRREKDGCGRRKKKKKKTRIKTFSGTENELKT